MARWTEVPSTHAVQRAINAARDAEAELAEQLRNTPPRFRQTIAMKLGAAAAARAALETIE